MTFDEYVEQAPEPHVLGDLADGLDANERSKGTVKLPVDRSLPGRLVKRLAEGETERARRVSVI